MGAPMIAHDSVPLREHPRTIGWLGTSALAMGGSNQMVFLVGALILAQGSGAIPILIVGVLLGWAAAPGWIELVLMWPKRVGGIAATCAEAFRPYSAVLANLTGVCYWWGWVPTCGFTAILSATALHQWYLPWIPVTPLAIAVVLAFTAINLLGVRTVTRVAIPVAGVAAALALLSAVVPILAGTVDYEQAVSFHLDTPFDGFFGVVTSAMAGLYLVGFAAPAFEAAACHVGETRDPERNVPRAMFASGAMAGVFFVVLPLVWLGSVGPAAMGGELMRSLGPTFAPLLAGGAKAAAIWFLIANMFMGTLQPLAGASRTLSQLSEDGLLPRSWANRNRRDVPWIATLLTAGLAIGALAIGVPTWMIAAANFTYLIGISLPSVAVLLLRRNEPERARPYRAPRGTIGLGVGAGCVWLLATCLGFEQFGLPTVLLSLGLAYAGSLFYAWRLISDRRRAGLPGVQRSLSLKLTGAMVAVMALDGAGYLLAVSSVDAGHPALVSLLQDIFVAVAILTITVGLVLPGIIAQAVEQISDAAARLATGTLADLTRAMRALSAGDLDAAKARVDVVPVDVRTRDEIGELARSFNLMQEEVGRAAEALDGAREGLRQTEAKLERNLAQQTAVARLGRLALEGEDLRSLLQETVMIGRIVLGAELSATIAASPDGRELVAGPTALEGMAVSIGPQDAPFGEMRVLRPASVAPFAPDEIAFLEATANVLADAIERRRSEEELQRQGLHDPLTGLPNRTLFMDRLSLALNQAPRRKTSVAVLFLDLDRFKLVNDSLGHSAGDELLSLLATRLNEVLRPGDTVARFGGDEFCVICDDLADPELAIGIAQRMTAALARPFTLGTSEQFVSASVGIAVAADLTRTAEDLVGEADAAMYRAKENGRGGFELFDAVMRGHASERLRIENDLRRALDTGDELIAHYQPIVTLDHGTIIGVEALARWNHPQRGLVPPVDFIPVAEESGAILAIGERVLRLACTEAARWNAATNRALSVSVNLSPRQVASPGLVATVAAVLEQSGLAPALLTLEITEGVLVAESEATAQTLIDLKALGLRLVLDDFGTGYSSLAYLRRFPIDGLKIDRRFIAAMDTSTQDKTIVEAIIKMAAGLQIDVVAEGVETLEQADSLIRLGCLHAQGFYYARPMAPGDVAKLFGSPVPPPEVGHQVLTRQRPLRRDALRG
jgi:diguanylate cyclase (GGDEF)-like protein